ncbi:MAG: hypothetical protein GYB67_17205 [Chloroflexi bacterium]|nr:hypothetical protein [Chloroflexota bacterium]
MASSSRTRFRRQIRDFVVVWAGITFIVGAATFIAIYITYGNLPDGGPGGRLSSVALPTATVAVAPTATFTLVPTVDLGSPTPTQPEPTPTPLVATAVSQAATALPTDPPPTATPRLLDDQRFQLGVQVQVSYDNMAQWLDVAANQLSVNWVKQQVRWADIAPAPGEFDWFYLDTYVPAAQAQGLQVLASVVTAPDWARDEGVELSRHGPPADPQDYADFVVAMLQRYPGAIHAVEVWNEQNLDREWTAANGLIAADYVELLRTTYAAVKAVDPDVIVISGALSPTGLSDGVRAWDDFAYMDQMIEAGLLEATDCVGAHHNGINVSPEYTWDMIPDDPTIQFTGPYDTPHHSWSFRSTLQTYANKVALAGGSQRLCVTEFGWPSAEGLDGIPEGFGFALDNTLEEQRDYTVMALDLMREWDTVWIAILWNLNYGPQAGWAADNDNVPYSIIGPGFVFRPVFDAVRDWNRAYEATFAAS